MRHAPSIKAGAAGKDRPRGARRWPYALTATVFTATAGLVAIGGPAGAVATPANSFAQTNLIAGQAGMGAKLVDKHLVNAWGLAAGPTTPIWVSDNNTGFASVYGGGVNGSKVTLDLTVPVPGGNPSGQVFNSDSKGFHVGGSKGASALFIVDTDSTGNTQSPGEIAAWNGGAKFVVEASPKGGPGGKTPAGAVFKGLAMATTPKAGPELFAADVANAKVDVFNSNFSLVKTPSEFRDPRLPKGYAPFGIQELGNKIYVAYGKQNKQKTNVVPGTGLGVVDVYNVNGQLLHHLVSNGSHSPLNEPWGLAIAPKSFGKFANDLLVGNLGNGWINAFNPTSGKYLGALHTTKGKTVVIPGLWAIRVGTSAFGGSNSLVFSAGPKAYAQGLVGILTPKASSGSGGGGGGWGY